MEDGQRSDDCDTHEILLQDLYLQQSIGKGSFGVIYKALWKGLTVAVKKVETELQNTAFLNEITQLIRVNHENIVHLYGACTDPYNLIIVEYADGGSLYELLHTSPESQYNLAHALSWVLQCAKAVAYLHAFLPRPILHRDLKSPNLLLTNGAKQIKLCDFGTACELSTIMSNNRGSAAWMAPEVFEGTRYTEKCDVYSWGILLWEVLTRRVPFQDLGLAVRIMWAVHQRQRPPLIRGCPKLLENIMKRCWDHDHAKRPRMEEIVEILQAICRLLKGVETPVTNPPSSEDSMTDSYMSPYRASSLERTSQDVSELGYDSNGLTELLGEPLNPPIQLPTVNLLSRVPQSYNDYDMKNEYSSSEEIAVNVARHASPCSTEMSGSSYNSDWDIEYCDPDSLNYTKSFPTTINVNEDMTLLLDQEEDQKRLEQQPIRSVITVAEFLKPLEFSLPSVTPHYHSDFRYEHPSLNSQVSTLKDSPQRSLTRPTTLKIPSPNCRPSPMTVNNLTDDLKYHQSLLTYAAQPYPQKSSIGCVQNTKQSATATNKEEKWKDDYTFASQPYPHKSFTGKSQNITLSPTSTLREEKWKDVSSSSVNLKSVPCSPSRPHCSMLDYSIDVGGHGAAASGLSGAAASSGDDPVEDAELGAFWELLEEDIRPIQPLKHSMLSHQIFQDHKEMAHNYLILQQELFNLQRQKLLMEEKLSHSEQLEQSTNHRYQDKIRQLMGKRDSLHNNHGHLKQQLEHIRSQEKRPLSFAEAKSQHIRVGATLYQPPP